MKTAQATARIENIIKKAQEQFPELRGLSDRQAAEVLLTLAIDAAKE